MMTNAKKIIFAICVAYLSVSCAQKREPFKINQKELIDLIENDSYRETFIEKWSLEPCYQDEQSSRFCYSDSLITFETISKEGFILSINNFPFTDPNDLVEGLKQSFESKNIASLEGYDKFLEGYGMTNGEYLYNNEYEVIITWKGNGGGNNSVCVITVNQVLE